MMSIRGRIVITAADSTPAEIEYTNDSGEIVGYWAYGSFDPAYPYQGNELEYLRIKNTTPLPEDE